MPGDANDAPIPDVERALLVRAAGHVDNAGPRRQGRQQQASQQERPEMVHPELLVNPLTCRHSYNACMHASQHTCPFPWRQSGVRWK